MKKAIFFAGLAAALAFTGCNKEADLAVSGKKVEIVLSNVDTRTVNDGMSTVWANDDALNVFVAPAGTTDYSENNKFVVDDAASNHATGTVTLGTGAYDWYLLYPYDSHVKTPANTSAGYLTVGSGSKKTQTQAGINSKSHLAGANLPVYGIVKNVPAEQTPVVSMKHVAAVICVNVTNGTTAPIKVTSVSFTAPVDIIGTYYIDFTGTQPGFVGSGDNYVSKTASLTVTGDETIAAGASGKFYMAVKPFEAKSGESLTLKVTADGKEFEKTIAAPANLEFKNGYIKTLNITYSGGAEVPSSTLAEIAAMDNDESVQTNEVLVVAKYARGIMLAENGHYLQAFDNAGVDGAVGDIVTVSGKVGEYAGLKQIVSPVVEVVSSNNTVTLPDPKALDAAGMDAYNSSKIELIQYVGVLKVSGNYYNVEVAGASRKGSIQYPLNTEALGAMAGKAVTATGFFTGISGSSTQYVNMMSTSVVEAAVNVFEVTPSQIDLPATATSAEITVSGNVAWTAEASAGAAIDTDHGTGAGTITVTFPANEDTENSKEYTVFVRTTASGVNDEFEVNITQAKAIAGTAIFTETFDQINGTGGRDGAFSGTVASNDFKDTDETWTAVDKMYGAKQCAKYGTSSVNGTMTTRSITMTGDAVLTFEAAGWGSGSNTLAVTASGATLSGDTSITLVNGTWKPYSVNITGVSGSFTLTFTGKRGFIDDIKVISESAVPPVTRTLVSIAVTGAETEFKVGQTFTHANAVVTATYDDNTQENVTSSAEFSSPDMTSAGTKTVTVTYTEGGVTKTANYNIVVSAQSSTGTQLTFVFSEKSSDTGTDQWPAAAAEAASTQTYTLDGTDYTFGLGKDTYMGTSSGKVFLMVKNGSYLGLPAIEGKKLVSVAYTTSSGASTGTYGAICTDTAGATPVTGGAAIALNQLDTEFTWTLSGTAANTMYYFVASKKNSQTVKIVLTYE